MSEHASNKETDVIPNRPFVFLCYSHKDRGIVKKARIWMEIGGTRCFIDRYNLRFGDRWEQIVDLAIQRSQGVVVFWCRHANSSKQVRREYVLANTEEKRIIPVKLDGTRMCSILCAHHYHDHSKSLGCILSHGLWRWSWLPLMAGIIGIISYKVFEYLQ